MAPNSSDLQCKGDEESLEDCRGKENPGCTRGEVAGVTCFLGDEENQPATTTTTKTTTTTTISSATTTTTTILPSMAKDKEIVKKIGGAEICRYSDKPNALAFAAKLLTDTIAEFAQSIYLHLAEKNKNGNFVFSPLGLHSALTMLYLATTANSTSTQELFSAIRGRAHMLCSYKSVIDDYSREKSFRYGNKFWLQKEFSRNTVLYLANALYFKEEWLVPFQDVNYDETPLRRSFEFETPAGSKDVPMIQQINYNATYREVKIFGDNEFVEVLSLPYKNDLFEMQIILPSSKKHLSIIETKMKLSYERDLNDNQEGYYNIFSLKKDDFLEELKEDVSEVHLRIPTFQIRSDLNVVDYLKKLGVQKVFESGAELEELGTGQLSVSKISHSALLEVSKESKEGTDPRFLAGPPTLSPDIFFLIYFSLKSKLLP